MENLFSGKLLTSQEIAFWGSDGGRTARTARTSNTRRTSRTDVSRGGRSLGGRSEGGRSKGKSTSKVLGGDKFRSKKAEGDTKKGGGSKSATLETGATVLVPLFIQSGEKINIDTVTGEYMSRDTA